MWRAYEDLVGGRSRWRAPPARFAPRARWVLHFDPISRSPGRGTAGRYALLRCLRAPSRRHAGRPLGRRRCPGVPIAECRRPACAGGSPASRGARSMGRCPKIAAIKRNASHEPMRPTAVRNRSKSDTPSVPHTTPSPSSVTDVTRNAASASAINGTRSVHSAALGEHPHAVTVAAADEAVAVVADHVRPMAAGRHRAGERWPAGLDETGRAASGSLRAPEHGRLHSSPT